MSKAVGQGRDFMVPGRSPAISDRGMVSTSLAAASLTAVEILKAGGNAVDAAIAAVAVQCVAEPHMTGIGGDCFVLYGPVGGRPVALNGSGRAPAAASARWYADNGFGAIPDQSAHAVTVPGAIDAWCRLSEDYGRLPLAEVLAPAIEAAAQGFLVTPRTAADWRFYQSRLKTAAAAAYLPGGHAPVSGDRLANPALAETLRKIARHGRSAFYEGEVAEEIVATLATEGGLHTLDDFASASADYVDPISAPYRGYTLVECPPNGQGLAALMLAKVLEGFDLSSDSWSEADRIHLLAEATKAVYAQRDTLVCDPAFASVDFREGLKPALIDRLVGSIDPRRAAASNPNLFPIHRDTVQVSVVDAEGNAVSLINSIYSAFGSGIYAPRSGVLLQDRGAGFSVSPGHPNAIGPRKRPFHTIIPALLMLGDKVAMSFGVVGAQYQAVGQVHVMSGVIDRGLDIQQASDAPRSFAFDGKLSLETTIPAAAAADLAHRGHTVEWAQQPIGGCQAVWIDHDRGILQGAADHRKDGIALGV